MADPRSEPSMEDILASIKRLISDDKQLPLAPVLPGAVPSLRPAAWPEPPAATFDPPPPWPNRAEPLQVPESILELTDRVPEAMQPPPAAPASHVAPPLARPESEPVAEAFVASRAIPPRDLGATIVNRTAGGDNTLEGLVREMLRPMLRDWVDAHLPAMVERIVQGEIQKLMDREGGA